jgi:glutathione S-transferase
LAKLIKSPNFQADLEKSFLDQVKKINDHLAAHAGQDFMAGSQISLIDFSLAPKLYHMEITLGEFYPKIGEKVKKMAGHLVKYMDKMFDQEAFKATKYPAEIVIWGWSAAKGTSK